MQKHLLRRRWWFGPLIGVGCVVAGVAAYAVRLAWYAPEVWEVPSSAKVWAHRGFTGAGAPENSLASYTAAVDRGAKGIELDVFFDVRTRRFVVAHDAEDAFAEEGTKPLADVFKMLGGRVYYWLDFKNLKDLPMTEVLSAAERLRSQLEQFELGSKVLVESIEPEALKVFAGMGIATSYWVSLNPDESWLKFWYHIWQIRRAVYHHRLSFVSMEHSHYITRVETSLSPIPVLLFTVNDPDLLELWRGNPAVEVLLTDTDHYSENLDNRHLE